jgi:hypothetical protein
MPDCVADDAVLCELLSASNSLIIRENTGNFRDFGRLGVELGPNKSCLLSGFCRNSLLNRTGNYFGGTGNFFDVTGNFQGGAGKFIWRAARRETPVLSGWMEF